MLPAAFQAAAAGSEYSGIFFKNSILGNGKA
jgi:hypothetical protein